MAHDQNYVNFCKLKLIFSSLLLPSTMASTVAKDFTFDLPMLNGIHGNLPGLEDKDFETYKEAIREDMLTPAREPQATLAFVRSILDEEVSVRDLANAKTTMVMGAEEVGSYLQGLGLDYQPWYDLIQVICPPR